MKSRWFIPVAIFLFSIVLSGCGGTFSTLMTAKPTEGMGIAFEGITLTTLSNATSVGSNQFIPNPMVWYRGMPVKDFLEIGGKISYLSIGADVKIIPLYLDFIGLAADLEVAYPYYYSAFGSFSFDFAASVLVTIQPIQFISLTVAPKFKYAALAFPMLGGSAVISLFNTPEFAMVFDVSYMTVLPGSLSSDNVIGTAINNALNNTGMLSFGVGLQF
jgi:hypothetical protein